MYVRNRAPGDCTPSCYGSRNVLSKLFLKRAFAASRYMSSLTAMGRTPPFRLLRGVRRAEQSLSRPGALPAPIKLAKFRDGGDDGRRFHC